MFEGLAYSAIFCAQSALGKNNVNVLGNKKNAIAKMTGITPAEFTFKGRYVACDPKRCADCF